MAKRVHMVWARCRNENRRDEGRTDPNRIRRRPTLGMRRSLVPKTKN